MSSLARFSVPADLPTRGGETSPAALWLGFCAWLTKAFSRSDSTPFQGL
ncbi:MAG TPA: hypothetical protein VKS60_05615 [Stellaceae bacterium]|nr:hypothetical protein [Stellaceae bacterium]